MDLDDPAPSDAESDALLDRQREANERLVLAGLLAQEEAESRETLIGIIGHDLRSPLSSILMAADLQVSGGRIKGEDLRLANLIMKTGQRMGRMIEQLVDFTRGRLGGGFELTLLPADLGTICIGIAEELRVGARSEIVHATDGNLVGVWDADRVAVVIQNLASNAVDHATTNTPVLVLAYDDGDHVICDISNQGPIIPPEILPFIFEPFRRTQTGARGASGHLGLGLYIAFEIVKAHGGSLDVTSAAGVTRFKMRLPRDSRHPAA